MNDKVLRGNYREKKNNYCKKRRAVNRKNDIQMSWKIK